MKKTLICTGLMVCIPACIAAAQYDVATLFAPLEQQYTRFAENVLREIQGPFAPDVVINETLGALGIPDREELEAMLWETVSQDERQPYPSPSLVITEELRATDRDVALVDAHSVLSVEGQQTSITRQEMGQTAFGYANVYRDQAMGAMSTQEAIKNLAALQATHSVHLSQIGEDITQTRQQNALQNRLLVGVGAAQDSQQRQHRLEVDALAHEVLSLSGAALFME